MTKPSSASANKPQALFLAAEAPYPITGGGSMRAASVLEYLAQRFSVHGIFFREPNAPHPVAAIPPGLVEHAGVIDLPFHSKGTASRLVRNAARIARNRPPLIDRFSGFGAQLAALIGDRQYAAAFIEHFWCAPYIEQIRTRAQRVVIDLHNIESAWHGSMAGAEPGMMAWAHRRFARASVRQEQLWLPQYDCVLVTSCDDAKQVQAIAPKAAVTVYPNSLPYIPPPPRSDRREIIFSGNLEYGPNIQAVRFFHHDIWPALRSRWPELKWKILSKNAGALGELAARDPNIEFTGFVKDAAAVIAQAQVAIVPLLAGSGTRIKILEAWAAATPVVSTTIGAEGLQYRDREHLVIADSPQPFAAEISAMLASAAERERIGAAGRRLYEERYTWQTAWRTLDITLGE